ncbi:hypothetical protein AAMO2058_001431700 [Amorphochlora amoebiformis]
MRACVVRGKVLRLIYSRIQPFHAAYSRFLGRNTVRSRFMSLRRSSTGSQRDGRGFQALPGSEVRKESLFARYRRILCANSNYIIHFGNALILLAINQTDMLYLRGFTVCATVCGIAFNLLQPKPLYAPAGWGVFFIMCHAYQISILARERRKITLLPDQEEVYEKAFMPFGFTPRQFLDIIETTGSRCGVFIEGEDIQSRGNPMDELHYVLKGNVAIINRHGDEISRVSPGKGAWLGEFYAPTLPKDYWEKAHPLPITFKCMSDTCRTMAVCRKQLYHTLDSNPRLSTAAARAEIDDLWGKMHNTMPQRRNQIYKGMLRMASVDGKIDPSELELLRIFRTRHGISQNLHDDIVAEMGFSVQDFNTPEFKPSDTSSESSPKP